MCLRSLSLSRSPFRACRALALLISPCLSLTDTHVLPRHASDSAVMETSDDAAVSKLSAVRKGYYRVSSPTPAPSSAHRPRPFCLCAHPAVCTRYRPRPRKISLRLPSYPHCPPGCAPGQDDYIQYFVARPANRPPLINRGHYSRVASIRKMISQFLVASRLQGERE